MTLWLEAARAREGLSRNGFRYRPDFEPVQRLNVTQGALSME